MKVAVTGGSGVVGAAVVRHLIRAGHDVKALARSEGSARTVVNLGAEAVAGDLLDSDSLRRLVEGCELVFHVAGVNQLCAADVDLMWRVNVEGTRRILEASRRSDVDRLIHTSSAVTVGERQGEVGTERTRHRGYHLSQYERTKTEAEHLVLQESGSMQVVSVNPSSVQGPGRSTGTGAIVLQLARGRLPVAIDTSISMVDIDDCARGHLLAAERGSPGERYILNGATLSLREAIEILGRVTGIESVPRFLPPWLLSVAATAIEGAYRLGRREPPVCRESIRVMRFGHRYDGTLATRELGLEYTPIEETVRKTVEWFTSEGLL